MRTERFPAARSEGQRRLSLADDLELTRCGDGGEVISSLVPDDLLERSGDVDLDEATLLSLDISLRLAPVHFGGLSVLLGGTRVVGRGGGESSEGEL